MGVEMSNQPVARGENMRLETLRRMLAVHTVDVKDALTEVSDLLSDALAADKVDAFLYDSSIDTLVALGTSRTPMGSLQHQLGLDKLPVSNGGRTIEVYQTGEPYLTGRADEDPGVLRGMTEGLGVRSMMLAPLEVNGERRGVLSAACEKPNSFSANDLQFLETAADWVGTVTHRAELVERITRDAAEQGRRVAAEELVTVLAHELGNHLTPLRARIAFIGRRAREESREKDIRDADEASRSLLRLTRLVRNLLDVSRLDRGLFAPACRPVDLVALARETVEILRTDKREICVEAADELWVDADPDAISQVLNNLLTNAIKHTPEGGRVMLELTLEKRADEEWAIVTVSDQGPGIGADLLPRLFNRFALGSGSQGLGLGLYTARGIAEAHGGTLTVDPAATVGACFRLSLPVRPRVLEDSPDT